MAPLFYITKTINSQTLYLSYSTSTPDSHFHPDSPSFMVSPTKPAPLTSKEEAQAIIKAYKGKGWKVTQA